MSLSRTDEDRVERALDDRLSPAEREALQRDVIADPHLRAAYVERAWLHAALRADTDTLRTLASAADDRAPERTRWPVFAGFTVLAAAAAVAIGFNVTLTRTEARNLPVATLVQAQNAKWSGSTLPTLEQSQLGRGMLALAEGIVTLRFNSGAIVVLEAPSKLEIVSAMNCRLLEGSLTAEVPPAAHGFSVDTADLKVVDIGTRFGVTAGSAGNSHVFVFEGEVILNQPDGTEVRRLTEGKSYHVASGATAPIVEPARFQPLQQIDGWTSIPTSFGRGRDAYARRSGNPTNAGSQPLLMVKHSDLESSRKNERRAVITFDVAGISPSRVEEAQIVLDPEPSGMGFTAMVPDSKFAVYGVNEAEGGDRWDEATLAWETLPACDDAGVIENRARKLAEFWLPRGGSGEPLTIRSDALAAFIREDRDGLVTFIIVRETGETHSSGLVHAFAAKEHPTGRPPTLRTR
ncbi:FecR domain-containing protein [Horticoccus sp. 23ND18S-11]|uniref:FecR domain-containing protein n=1 Tax=Horticoccus sp. 23ND18S-11 TaxID=3391832 RepID=UPI0039C982D2